MPHNVEFISGSTNFKGFLVDQDVRWNVVSGAVDDRTFIEKGQEPYSGYHLFGGLDIDAQDKLRINNHQINQQGDLLIYILKMVNQFKEFLNQDMIQLIII